MSSHFKKYIIAAFAIFLLGVFIMKAPVQTGLMPSNETLVIGLQSGYPPFEFMDGDGDIVGFDVDLAKRIAEKLEKNLVIQDMEFEGQILSLKQGKIDLILSGMNITMNRLKEIAMVPYYGESPTTMSLLFWKEIPLGVHSLADIAALPHISLSVESGSIPEAYISHYPSIPVKAFQGSLAPLMDVKYGKSTANLVQREVAEFLKRSHPEIQILDIPLAQDDSILGFGIGIKKENLELIQQIQTIIQQLKTTGELKQLEEKWFKGEE